MKKTDYYTLILEGQVRGGKNNMKVTRSGHHYPNPSFLLWATTAILSLKRQKQFPTLCDDNNGNWCFIYTPADRKRRDITAILDSVFHCLERAMIVSDDSIIRNITFITLPPNKNNPKLEIILPIKKPSI